MTTIEKVNEVLARLAKMLAEKNESYGDSAAKPLRVFSRSGPEEGLLNRIDDKLSRIANGKEFPGDNDVFDLAGYLVLLMAIRENKRMEGEKAPAKVSLPVKKSQKVDPMKACSSCRWRFALGAREEFGACRSCVDFSKWDIQVGGERP